MKLILCLVFFMSGLTYASTCKRLVDCVNEASKLTGIKYIYPENTFNNKHELNVQMLLDKSNADTVLSEALAVFDFMKIPTKVKGVWKIIPGMDIRYHADLPSYKASKKVTPKLPANQDPIHFSYQTQKGADTRTIAMNLRSFVSRFGRIIDVASGLIVIIDRATVINKILPILQAADVPSTKPKAKAKAHDHEHEKHVMEEIIEPAPGMEEQLQKKK